MQNPFKSDSIDLKNNMNNDSDKAWMLLEKVVSSSQMEQRKARRWGIFFKSLTFVYLFILLSVMFSPSQMSDGGDKSLPHTAVIEVKGTIAPNEEASADNIISGLRTAFENEQAKAVVLRINSPGGSPVQSGYVYDEIQRLKALHNKPVYAVIADIGASGAYYIAAAADYIYADKASLVGSIGVISSGFGFTDTLEKVGVERRVYAAGAHKAFLDPFSPLKEDEQAFWESVLKVTHQQFINKVKEGRGTRLREIPDLFSGLIWSGEQALEFGLIDGLGSTSYVAREVIKAEEMVDYSMQKSQFEAFVKRFGVSIGYGFANEIKSSALNLQ